jgi:exodeoxyribonuclease V alpha subunit
MFNIKKLLMIKGHIHKILWNKVMDKNCDFLEVGFIIKDLDNDDKIYKIKGSIRIEPYPSINDYIIAHKTDKMYSNDFFICSSIYIELPVKKDFIFNKIIKFSDKLLTKKEATFLIENNKDMWNSIENKKLEIAKIKQSKIDIIYDNFDNEKISKDPKEKLKDFLFKCGIILKNNQINNLMEKYETSNEVIYIMNNDLINLSSVDGISITTLIYIADKLNHSEDEKIKLFIIYNLKYSSNGDTCVNYNKLIANILKEKEIKFSKSLNKEYIDNIIDKLIDNEYIIRYNEYLYESKVFNYENNIGSSLKFMNHNNSYLENFLKNAENFLEDYEGNKLNNEQRESFLSIFSSNVNITIGPAGTGKSEILTRLCEFVNDYNEISILFLTPTGKACDRLTKGFNKNYFDIKSYTIHKFINYNYDSEYKNEEFDQIIKNKYKIFVIDEMSMIGLNVFNIFINKINELSNCILLVLGDTNQLPSIDCGDILNNLVLSNSFNLVELKEIFRSESKNLLVVQNNILTFKPLLENIVDNDNSFKWIKDDPKNNEIVLKVLYDFTELPLIITSTNKVVNEYQNIIKKKYNINYSDKKNTIINNIIFHEDDYIMIKKNDHESGLTNGMVGKIISIVIINEKNKNVKKEISILEILFDGEKKSKKIDSEKLGNMNMGYLMTIHKSQGSESDNVIILLDEASKLNTMNLLYTGITRSKKKCILISLEKTVQSIINEKKKTKRICNLKDFC